jgi:ethanolamine ammonia-lyase small subunit
MASLERFGRSSPLPVLLQVSVRQSLESVAYAHTAADLHVRPVSRTALVKDRGRREQLTNTPWGAGSNEIDSRISAVTTARGALQRSGCSPRKSNALIHFADSSRAADCDIFAEIKNKRHISFKEARR